MNSTESPHPQSAAPRRKLLLTEADLARLRPIVRSAKHFLKGRPYIELIDQTLNDAGVIPPGAIPQDVVTVNSSVMVTDLDHNAANRLHRRISAKCEEFRPLGLSHDSSWCGVTRRAHRGDY